MKRIDSGYKLIEVLSGRRGSAETVVNVATVKFGFGAVVLIEKLVFNVAYEKISVAGSHFSTHDHAFDLFKIIAREKKKQLSVNTSSARRSSVSELGSLAVRKSKKCLEARSPSPLGHYTVIPNGEGLVLQANNNENEYCKGNSCSHHSFMLMQIVEPVWKWNST